MSMSTVPGAPDRTHVGRAILLAETDDLCRALRAAGFPALADRVRVAVDEHERRCLERHRAPKRAPFVATAAEAGPLTAALALVRGRA